MGAGAWSIVITVLAVSVGLYQVYVVPVLDALNIFRMPQPLNSFQQCYTEPRLQACEKLTLHQPSGKLFVACAPTPGHRSHWIPATGALNVTGRSNEDYIAIYDPASKEITRLAVDDFNSGRGLSVHGMDVVASASDPNELYVYLINHRVPLKGAPADVGADSAVEIFKTTLTSGKLTHLKTVEDPKTIITPNDLIGDRDGKGFYFTNDHRVKTAFARDIREFYNPGSSVGYCHTDEGCRFVAQKMKNNNGIAAAPNGTIYVASTAGKQVSVFDRQEDNSIVLTDVIPCEVALDNVAIDSDGVVWAAGFPNGHHMGQHMKDPSHWSPGGAWKFGINTGPNSFYGEKFKVEKAFEDDGTLATGTTSVVHDAQRGLVFLHGLAAPWLTICKE